MQQEELTNEFRYLDCTLAGIEANLALDEALLNQADREGGPSILRVWELPSFAVVLGASCRHEQAVRMEVCRQEGVPIARRSSGGGAVVIGPGALNVTVILPIGVTPGIGAVDVAQRFVLERIAKAIRALGPPVEVLGSGDLTIGLRKFSGSAQRRLRHYFLVHASILYGFPLDRISRYLGIATRQPNYRENRSHEEFVTNLNLPRATILEAVRSAWLPEPREPLSVEIPKELVRGLTEERFGDPAWILRL